jgi:hypothetical protein
MDKVEIVWNQRWWPAHVTSITIASLASSPTYHPWPWFLEPLAARNHPLGWGTLVCYITGQFAEEVEAMEESAVIASAVAALRQACQCHVPEPLEVHITRWGKDSFARGSWTYYATNSSLVDVRALAEPIGSQGRVAFAGEHTCDGSMSGLDMGTVHGAWVSGQVAVAGLVEKLGSDAPHRCDYRHRSDCIIPEITGYQRGAKVMITQNPEEIAEELKVDPDECPNIEYAKMCCGKFGQIVGRSQWGWLQVSFEDGTPGRWFTPYCLWIFAPSGGKL